MKRSKMLLIIEKELYRKRGKTEDLDPRVQAALMLEVIEKTGMLPPVYVKALQKPNEHNVDGEFINEWEPEDNG